MDSVSGDILIKGSQNRHEAYAQIGHGGYDSDNPNQPAYPGTATHSLGNIGDIFVRSVDGNILLNSFGSQNNSYSHIGHGGTVSIGSHDGDITVDTTNGSVILDAATGTTGSNRYAQIGHGGHFGYGENTGNITVGAGADIRLLAGRNSAYAHIGHGGRADNPGTAIQATDPDNTNPANARFYERRTGAQDYVPGTLQGNIILTAGGNLDLLGVDALGQTGNHGGGGYAQVGHGGFRRSANPHSILGSGHNGSITVDVTGNVRMLSGFRTSETYSQIGHGGYQAYGNHGHSSTDGSSATADRTGSAITVNIGGTLEMRAQGGDDTNGWGRRGYRNYSQIGHGGWDAEFKRLNADGFATLQWFGPIDIGTGVNPPPATPPTPYSLTDNDPGAHPNAATLTVGDPILNPFGGATALGTIGNISVTTGGDVVISTDDSVNVAPGTSPWSQENYAQIGNGGYGNDPTTGLESIAGVGVGHIGDIVVNSGGTLDLIASKRTNGGNNFVMVGNGGQSARGNHDGNITVTANGAILLEGGIGNNFNTNNVMIGHGGMDARAFTDNDGSSNGDVGNTGNISVTTNVGSGGDIVLQAGDRAYTFAQIGHGGRLTRGDHSGEVHVISDGAVHAFGGLGTLGWNSSRAYAQIGHGGEEADGNHSGLIKVRAQDELFMRGGVSYRNYSQIGHGGRLAAGNQGGAGDLGLISVVVGLGGDPGVNSIIQGGGSIVESNETSAQIGHGGLGGGSVGGGTTTGDIEVFVLNHGLDMIGGTNITNNDAWIGSGDGGNQEGDITVMVQGELSLEDNTAQAQIRHLGTLTGNSNLTILAGALDFDSTDAASTQFIINGTLDARAQDFLNNGGNVTYGGGVDLVLQSSIDYNGIGDLNLLAGRHVYISNFARNQLATDGGDINVIAGYDFLNLSGFAFDLTFTDREIDTGGNLDISDPALKITSGPTPTLVAGQTGYGQNVTGLGNGEVFVGRNLDAAGNVISAISDSFVGTRSGDTNVLGYNVNVLGGGLNGTDGDAGDTRDDRASQIGYQNGGTNQNPTGNIMVHAINDVLVEGGMDQAAAVGGDFGGADVDNAPTGDFPGVGDVDRNGNGILDSGTGRFAYGRIGHGGIWSEARQNFSGMIEVVAGNDTSLNAGTNRDNIAQIGHGGLYGQDNNRVTGATGAIHVLTGNNLNLNGGAGDVAFALIGHGGRDSRYNQASGGDILVRAEKGNVAMTGHSGSTAGDQGFTQIGHGGWSSFMTVGGGSGSRAYDKGRDGSITVTAGYDSGTGALIGGNITSSVLINGGNRNDAYGLIGHGGRDSGGAHSGGITVNAANSLTAVGGQGVQAASWGQQQEQWVQVGHGGENSRGDHSGSISVTTGDGGVNFTAGTSWISYAQLGHGGYDADNPNGFPNSAFTRDQNIGNWGTIDVITSGDVRFTSGNDLGGTSHAGRAYTQLGHGGLFTYGNHGEDPNNLGDTEASKITVDADGVVAFAGGSSTSGDQWNQREQYTQLGHGGFEAWGDNIGDIDVSGDGGVVFTAGETVGRRAYAQLGNGGFTTRGNHAGHITVHGGGATVAGISGGVQFLAAQTGNSEAKYAMLGHGGWSADFDDGPPQVLTAQTNATLDLETFEADNGWVTITGGIRIVPGSVVITIPAGTTDPGRTITDNGTGQLFDGATQVGTIEYTNRRVRFNVVVNPEQLALTYNVDRLLESDNNNATDVGNIGNIAVTTADGGDVVFGAGAINDAFSQLGHGGRGTHGNNTGTINVFSTGNVSFNGGTGNNEAYSQLGHGGIDARGDQTGAIDVRAVNNVSFLAGTNGRNYAHLGHGGRDADRPNNNTTTGNTGTINVATQDGNITFTANSGEAYAQLGHGGYDTRGAHNGAITVRAGYEIGTAADLSALDTLSAGGTIANLTFTGGGGTNAYAILGHGGNQAFGNHVGNIDVRVANEIAFTAGTGSRTNAQLGHGGHTGNAGQGGDITGTIKVETESGDIKFYGTGSESYAQLGHMGMRWLGNIVDGHIDVDSGGAVDFKASGAVGGNTWTGYSMLGHGGWESRGNRTGNIDVDAGGEVLVDSRLGVNGEFAMIGHGGRDANGTLGGNIAVRAGGDISVLASDQTRNQRSGYSPAQIGHGGYQSTGAMTGDVFVESGGNILVEAGNSGDAYAQIGNGGVDANGGSKNGNIHVGAAGDITLRSGGHGQPFAYAMIGQGGFNADGGHAGDISVHADRSISLDSSLGVAGGQFAFTRIGNGGYNTGGNHSGFITVTSGEGGISLVGGSGNNDQTSSIGHGGLNANGNHSGSISIVALDGTIAGSGTVSLQGGNGGDWRGAIIGHGDAQHQSNGTRTGGLNIYAEGDITAIDGDAGNAAALIGHQTNSSNSGVGQVFYTGSGIQAAGSSGFSLVSTGGSLNFSNSMLSGIAPDGNNIISLWETIPLGLGGGNVTLASGNNLNLAPIGALAPIYFTSANDLTLASGGDLTLGVGLQNRGDGNMTLMAGADMANVFVAPTMTNTLPHDPTDVPVLGSFSLPDFQPPVLVDVGGIDCNLFGVGNQGTVFLGDGTQSEGIAFGSRQGTTLALGYAVELNAGNDYSQIGFRSDGSGDVTGDIGVFVHEGGLTLQGGGTAEAYAQIGHGGTGVSANAILNTADIEISFCEVGDLTMNGGTALRTFAQIGNGHFGVVAQTDGDISITGFRNIDMNSGVGVTAYTQIGNGGDDSDGSKVATITLTGANTLADRGDITMNGGNTDAYSQIGHGGRASNDPKSGNINISQVVNIDMDGGTGGDSHVQIGHGGNDNSNGPVSGDIDINISGNLMINAGTSAQAYAQIGHGGHSQVNGVMTEAEDNDITITTGGYVEVVGTSAGTSVLNPAAQAYAQIGHGGRGSRGGDAGATARERFGNITLDINGAERHQR